MAHRVSVIVPAKNSAATIEVSVQSVLDQSRPPDEVIVILGPSNDGTAKIVRNIPEILVLPDTGVGMVAAFNLGVASACGDYIAFNGADDVWMPDKLAAQLEMFDAEPDLQLVSCRLSYFCDRDSTPPPGFKKALLEGTHIGNNCETLLARRELFDRIGRFNPEFSTAFDVEFFARLVDSGLPWRVCQQMLVRKRVHSESAHLQDIDASNQQLLHIISASLHRKRQHPPQ